MLICPHTVPAYMPDTLHTCITIFGLYQNPLRQGCATAAATTTLSCSGYPPWGWNERAGDNTE